MTLSYLCSIQMFHCFEHGWVQPADENVPAIWDIMYLLLTRMLTYFSGKYPAPSVSCTWTALKWHPDAALRALLERVVEAVFIDD